MNDAVAGVKQICGELLRCLSSPSVPLDAPVATATTTASATVVEVITTPTPTPASAPASVPITVQRLYEMIDALNQNMWLKRCILG